jgi:hypothetical protein
LVDGTTITFDQMASTSMACVEPADTGDHHRASRPISLADAILVASASPGDRIATADPDVLAVAKAEAIATIALPSQV